MGRQKNYEKRIIYKDNGLVGSEDVTRLLKKIIPIIYQYIPILLMVIMGSFAGKEYKIMSFWSNIIIINVVDIAIAEKDGAGKDIGPYYSLWNLVLILDIVNYVLIETNIINTQGEFIRMIFAFCSFIIAISRTIYDFGMVFKEEI